MFCLVNDVTLTGLLQGLHLCALFLKSLRQPCLRRARRRPYVSIAYVSHSAVSVVSVVSVSLWHSHWTLPQYFEKAWLSILTHGATQFYRVLQPVTYRHRTLCITCLLFLLLAYRCQEPLHSTLKGAETESEGDGDVEMS